jgi:hypothetical protein
MSKAADMVMRTATGGTVTEAGNNRKKEKT